MSAIKPSIVVVSDECMGIVTSALDVNSLITCARVSKSFKKYVDSFIMILQKLKDKDIYALLAMNEKSLSKYPCLFNTNFYEKKLVSILSKSAIDDSGGYKAVDLSINKLGKQEKEIKISALSAQIICRMISNSKDINGLILSYPLDMGELELGDLDLSEESEIKQKEEIKPKVIVEKSDTSFIDMEDEILSIFARELASQSLVKLEITGNMSDKAGGILLSNIKRIFKEGVLKKVVDPVQLSDGPLCVISTQFSREMGDKFCDLIKTCK